MLALSFSSPPLPRPRRRIRFDARRKPPSCARVPPAEFGGLSLWPPIVQASVSGWTEPPFRDLCRSYGASLCVAGDVHARAILERGAVPRFCAGENVVPRSVRLHAAEDAGEYAAAAAVLADAGVRHIDVNFGGYTARQLNSGAGALLTRNPQVVRQAIEHVVREVGDYVAVTASFRIGISWLELTYPKVIRVARDAGAHALIVHTRTATDEYAMDGRARRAWIHARNIIQGIDIPVLLEGDIFSAADAMKAFKFTKCSGLVLAHESIGRPWLYGDIATACRAGWAAEPTNPSYTYVARTAMRHLNAHVEWHGGNERAAVASFRKWYQHYFDGYNGLPHQFVVRLCKARSLDEVRTILDEPRDDNVGFDYLKGYGKKTRIQLPPRQPPKPPIYTPKKRKSASQRGPVTLKGNIEKILRDKATKERDAKEEEEKKRKRREDRRKGYIF